LVSPRAGKGAGRRRGDDPAAAAAEENEEDVEEEEARKPAPRASAPATTPAPVPALTPSPGTRAVASCPRESRLAGVIGALASSSAVSIR
jgi:hypothetical protein